MAKTGYKISYVIKKEGDDLSSLKKLHNEVFPNNELAIWKGTDGVVVKVSNYDKVQGESDILEAFKKAGYAKEI